MKIFVIKMDTLDAGDLDKIILEIYYPKMLSDSSFVLSLFVPYIPAQKHENLKDMYEFYMLYFGPDAKERLAELKKESDAERLKSPDDYMTDAEYEAMLTKRGFPEIHFVYLDNDEVFGEGASYESQLIHSLIEKDALFSGVLPSWVKDAGEDKVNAIGVINYTGTKEIFNNDLCEVAAYKFLKRDVVYKSQ